MVGTAPRAPCRGRARIDGVAGAVRVQSAAGVVGSPSWPIEVHAKLAVAADGACQILRMIEEIEEVHLELHLDPLCQLKVLAEGQVYGVVTRPRADAKALAALLADLEAVQGEHVGVKPLPRVARVGAATLARDAHRDFVAAPSGSGEVANGGVSRDSGHRGARSDTDDGADFPRP